MSATWFIDFWYDQTIFYSPLFLLVNVSADMLFVLKHCWFLRQVFSHFCAAKKLFFGLVNEYPLESLWLINTFSWSCNFRRYKLGLRIYRRLWLSRYTICFSMQRGVSRLSRKNHDFHCEMSPFLTAVPINNPISFAQPPRHFIFVLPCVHAPLFYSQEGDDETGMCIF